MSGKSKMMSSMESVAKAASRNASSFNRTLKSRKRSQTTSSTKVKVADKVKAFLSNLKDTNKRLKSDDIQKRVKTRFVNIGRSYPQEILGSQAGTPLGVLNSAFRKNVSDPVSDIVGNVAAKAAGVIDGTASLLSESTMQLAKNMASGQVSVLATNILGEAAETIGKKLAAKRKNPRSESAKIPVEVVGEAVQAELTGLLEQSTAAMAKGYLNIEALDPLIGTFNGATDLLTAQLNKATNMQLAEMMQKIVSSILTAKGISEPLFVQVFESTWSENRQWCPRFIDPDQIPAWMQPEQELIEYFDFVQNVMSGAIDDVCKTCDKLFTDVVRASGGLKVSLEGEVSMDVELPRLEVPLMSISKQINDAMNKLMVVKEIIRQRGRLVLEKLKSLEASELYINKPSEFIAIIDVLVEAEFILANLPIMMDKVLECFINQFVQAFATISRIVVFFLFRIWARVVAIVPPLQDLLQMSWVIPNSADACMNVALNLSLPTMWEMVQPMIMMPVECINMIQSACDEATEVAQTYYSPPQEYFDNYKELPEVEIPGIIAVSDESEDTGF